MVYGVVMSESQKKRVSTLFKKWFEKEKGVYNFLYALNVDI